MSRRGIVQDQTDPTASIARLGALAAFRLTGPMTGGSVPADAGCVRVCLWLGRFPQPPTPWDCRLRPRPVFQYPLGPATNRVVDEQTVQGDSLAWRGEHSVRVR
jgi:hypothetical protein